MRHASPTRCALILGAILALVLPATSRAADQVRISDSGSRPVLAVAPDGTALVAWAEYDDATHCGDVRYVRFSPNGAMEPEAGPPGAGPCANRPDAVANPDGSFTLVWIADGGGDPQRGRRGNAEISRIAADGTAGNAELLGPSDKAVRPVIAGGPDGASVVVYRGPQVQGDPERSFRARAVQISPEGSPGPGVDVSRTEAGYLDVAVDDRGQARIGWSTGLHPARRFQNVQARTLLPDGGLTKLRTLSAPREGGEDVTVEAAGSRAIVTWLGRKGVRACELGGNGEVLRDAVTLSLRRLGSKDPSAALTPSGRATVVWSKEINSKSRVFRSGLSARGQVLAPKTILKNGRAPALTTTGSGDVLLGWAKGWGEGGSFFGTLRPGGQLTESRPLVDGRVEHLSLASDPGGGVVAAATLYEQSTGEYPTVFVRTG